jgi:hypothetical protein
MASDYIPEKNSEFNEFQDDMHTKVTTNATAWGVPNAQVTQFTTYHTGYVPIYDAVRNKRTRTTEAVIANDAYRLEYDAFLRTLVQGYIVNNPVIPISERAAMGLNPRGLRPRSQRTNMVTSPVPDARPLGGGMIQFTFKVADSAKRASRDPMSNGIMVYFRLVPPSGSTEPLVDKPENSSEMDGYEQIFSTRAKFTKQFDRSYIGYTLYFYSRWINTSDPSKNSPFSSLISVVIA